jgi:hypothetical protein
VLVVVSATMALALLREYRARSAGGG